MLAELLVEQIGRQPKSQVEELVLDGWKCGELTLSDKNLLEELGGLEFLSMNGCGLTSLKNFPTLPQLLKLDLNGNKLTTGLQHLQGLQNLMQLSLADNGIKTLGEIEVLAGLPALIALDTTNCPVTALPGYRDQVFAKLDSLSVLDRTDEEGKEVSEGGDSEFDSEIDAEEDDLDSESSDSEVQIPVRRGRPGVHDSDSDSSDSGLGPKKQK